MNEIVPVQKFTITSDYKPAGDQPQAIAQLVDGLRKGLSDQVLLGVTGSGKTFTMAQLIQEQQRPALILAPNKTLAAQLYGEMKQFFPNNSVEFFIFIRALSYNIKIFIMNNEKGGSYKFNRPKSIVSSLLISSRSLAASSNSRSEAAARMRSSSPLIRF